MNKNRLIHLIYSSAATFDFSEEDLMELLDKARKNNSSIDVTGMLLYAERSFFQVLEGEEDVLVELFDNISLDDRHDHIVTIMKEPIAHRSFGEWTMGYTNITPKDVGEIIGLNDFFMQASCFGQIDHGRAKKLLTAFKRGSWRTRISNTSTPVDQKNNSVMQPASMSSHNVSFAYQPIVDANNYSVVSFEAIPCGKMNEPIDEILQHISPGSRANFESFCHRTAIQIAADLGLQCNLSLKLLALDIENAKELIKATIEAAEDSNVVPSRIILEVDQSKLKFDEKKIGKIINGFRKAGVKIAIDKFGEGLSGLNLIEHYRPEILSFNKKLVRNINTDGPRQAIVRGVAHTCAELGIDIVVKYIQTPEEFAWFRNEGVHLFQGNLFASPEFEQLPIVSYPTN